MVGRFPIFIVGVIIALSKNKSNVYYALLVCLTFWNISVGYELSSFLDSAAICPIIVLLTSPILLKVPPYIMGWLRYVGKYSYELFTADFFTGIIINNLLESNSLLYNPFILILGWFFMTLLFGTIAIILNTIISKILG